MRPAVTITIGGDLDIMGDIQAAIRPAAQAGAQVFYDEVKRNVASLGKKTGNLDSAIYQVYSNDNSGPLRATYQIGWNTKKAPHGHLIEYGHKQYYKVVFNKKKGKFITFKTVKLATPKQIPAHPFMRPAWAVQPFAEAAIEAEIDKRL